MAPGDTNVGFGPTSVSMPQSISERQFILVSVCYPFLWDFWYLNEMVRPL